MPKYLLFLLMLLLVATVNAQEPSPIRCELEQLSIQAALGDTTAQYNLGVEFFRGDRVSRDYAKAAKMWQMASDAGSVEASNNLGFLKYYGRPGVEKDQAEGIRLWRFAAERGFAESQVHMAQAYSDGRFLKSDFIEAYAWAKTGKHYSAKMTDTIDDPQIAEEIRKDADEVLVETRKKLSAQQFAAAEQKAAEYIRKLAPQ